MTSVQKPVSLDPASFDREVRSSETPVLVDFYADWCGPCRAIAPAVDELAAEFDGSAKIAKVDVQEHPELAARYGVQSIPTLILFQDGEEVQRVNGVVSKEVLADKLHGLGACGASCN